MCRYCEEIDHINKKINKVYYTVPEEDGLTYISYDVKGKQFSLTMIAFGAPSTIISHCPWCGRKLEAMK